MINAAPETDGDEVDELSAHANDAAVQPGSCPMAKSGISSASKIC